MNGALMDFDGLGPLHAEDDVNQNHAVAFNHMQAGIGDDDPFVGDAFDDFDRLETESGPAVLIVPSARDEDFEEDVLMSSFGR
ncbi:unnamed protein product, partial [Amoebophrya sp. A25]|eukprot:GSA25T00018886001.1